MRFWLALLFFLFVPPAFGQTSLLGDAQTPGTLVYERAKFGTPMTPTQIGQMLNAVAVAHRSAGWKLLAKPSGNNCPQPVTNTRVSCDYLVFGPTGQGFDVLRDQEGAGTVAWNQGDSFTAERYVEPVGDAPQPDPNPQPPPFDPSSLWSAIRELQASRDAHQQEIQAIARDAGDAKAEAAKANAGVDLLAGKVTALEARPVVTSCRATANLGFARIPISCSVQ